MTQFKGILEEVKRELGRRYGLRLEEISDATLLHAVEGAAGTSGVGDGAQALAALTSRDGRHEFVEDLVRRVTIGETTFFRHQDDLPWLREQISQVIERRRKAGVQLVRMWSAGCSTGEEPYTLAMLGLELAGPEMEIQILGTDINRAALANAQRAEYGEWSFRGVADDLRRSWFEQVASGRWRPAPSVKGRVSFDYLNLRDPIYPTIFTRTTDLDGILCRNVFIYFHPEVVSFALTRMAECVKPDGFILCGPSDVLHCDPPPVLEVAGGIGAGRHRMRRHGAGAALGVGGTPAKAARPKATAQTSRPTPFAPKVARAVGANRSAARAAGGKAAAAPAAAVAAVAAVAACRAGLATHDEIIKLLRAGRYPEAARAAEARLEAEPLDVEAARLAALAYADLEDLRAIEAWKKVLYLASTDAGAHMGAALVYRRLRRDADARRHFRQVVRLLEGRSDKDTLPGPDALTVGWVRQMCRSLGREPGEAES